MVECAIFAPNVIESIGEKKRRAPARDRPDCQPTRPHKPNDSKLPLLPNELHSEVAKFGHLRSLVVSSLQAISGVSAMAAPTGINGGKVTTAASDFLTVPD